MEEKTTDPKDKKSSDEKSEEKHQEFMIGMAKWHLPIDNLET